MINKKVNNSIGAQMATTRGYLPQRWASAWSAARTWTCCDDMWRRTKRAASARGQRARRHTWIALKYRPYMETRALVTATAFGKTLIDMTWVTDYAPVSQRKSTLGAHCTSRRVAGVQHNLTVHIQQSPAGQTLKLLSDIIDDSPASWSSEYPACNKNTLK